MSDEEKPKEKAEEKPKAKPAAKKEAKPAVKPKAKGGAIKTIEDRLEKMGYMDIYDLITLIIGVWGIIWSIVGFTNIASTLAGLNNLQLGNEATNLALANLGIFVVQMYIYLSLALFPFFVNGGMKIINKLGDSFPLHFIKTKEDFRTFIVFLGWWCTLIFWVGGASGLRWPHAISFLILILVIFADGLRKKISALPEKKIRE